jgi:hypothetical protein
MIFLTPVFFCMLGFGDADYYGPMGEGDKRTSQARAAKTVNFEVVEDRKEEPVQHRQEPVVEEVKPAEPIVEVKVEPEVKKVEVKPAPAPVKKSGIVEIKAKGTATL